MENDFEGYDDEAITPPPPYTDADPTPLNAEEEEFEKLYCDLEKLFLRISRKTFGIPEDDMETIVHDVFISYLANPAVVRGDVRRYLISSVYFASRNYWRSKRYENRVFSAEDVQALDETGKASADCFFNELCLGLDVLTTLGRLPARCREVLTLCWSDAEPDVIAEVLNTPQDNVRKVIHKCRKRARDIYDSLTRVP